MRDYKKIRVWASAHALAIKVRQATTRFPRRGYASLKEQIVRAAESIVFNIVEGAGASTQREFARFSTSVSSQRLNCRRGSSWRGTMKFSIAELGRV